MKLVSYISQYFVAVGRLLVGITILLVMVSLYCYVSKKLGIPTCIFPLFYLVRAVLKSPWIAFILTKFLKFCLRHWKVLECFFFQFHEGVAELHAISKNFGIHDFPVLGELEYFGGWNYDPKLLGKTCGHKIHFG